MGCATSCNPSSPPDSPFRTYVAPMLVTQLVDLASRVEATDEVEDEEADRGVPDGRDGNTSACSVRTLQSLLERGQQAGSGASCTLHVPHQTSIDSEVTVYSEWSECTVAGNDRNTEDCDTRTKTENSDDDLRASSLTRQEMGGKVLLY